MAKKVSEDQEKTSFASKQPIHSIKTYKHVLKEYKVGIDLALKFEGETPIFLDANVLLSVYEVSFKAREKIKQFIRTYKDRIILTSQVQYEFIRNREKTIYSFQNSVTEQLPKSFMSDVQNKLTVFRNNNKKKLEDYPAIESSLDKLEKTISKLHDDIVKNVEDKSGIASTLSLDDDFLDLLAELNTLSPLDCEYVKTLKIDYDNLLKVHKPIGKSNQNEEENSSKNFISLTAFPGCGEKSSKEDPTGDFIIFHEMMEHALKNNTDVIFLTNDVTKGDWIRTDGKSHTHYLENFYENTGQLIYILNAERSFEKLFEDVSFESLVPVSALEINESQEDLFGQHISNRINLRVLNDFLKTYQPFSIAAWRKIVNPLVVFELSENGYIMISELKDALDKTVPVIGHLMAKNPRYSTLQLMRSCLRVLNRDYVILEYGGTSKKLDKTRFDYLTNLLDIL